MFFNKLTDTRWAAGLLGAALLAVYVALPLFVNAFFLTNPYFVQLALLSLVAIVAIATGYALPLFDERFRKGVPQLVVSEQGFHVIVWGTFMVFLVITFTTAPSVPLLSAIGGADAAELSLQRGDFLKARTGIEAALIYVSTLFVSALLPYSLAKLFIKKSRLRFVLLLLFLAYSLSFLQKALFINVVFPLLYLAARNRNANTKRIMAIVFGSGILLYLVTLLAFGSPDDVSPDPGGGVVTGGDFFGASYLPSNALEHLIWRSTAVPMFSASDTLLVHNEQFGAQLLWGATSSFFAGVLGLERVPMERLVSEYEWGWNDIANSNAVYVTEAFVNFGWIGVVAFSLFVGQSLRWFRRSRDEAFKSLWTIYCLAVFTSGLIGTLLSNGYLLIFFMALMVRLKDRGITRRARAATFAPPEHDPTTLPVSMIAPAFSREFKNE